MSVHIVKPDPYVQVRHREAQPSPYGPGIAHASIKLFPPVFDDGLCRVAIGDKETWCEFDELLAAVLDLRTLLPKGEA